VPWLAASNRPSPGRVVLYGSRPAHAAQLRGLAVQVGQRLSADFLSPAALEQLRHAIGVSQAAVPPLLHVRVRATDEPAAQRRGDQILALPWELVVVEGQFPVERGKLDVAREVVKRGAQGLAPPERPRRLKQPLAGPHRSHHGVDHLVERSRAVDRVVGRGDQRVEDLSGARVPGGDRQPGADPEDGTLAEDACDGTVAGLDGGTGIERRTRPCDLTRRHCAPPGINGMSLVGDGSTRSTTPSWLVTSKSAIFAPPLVAS